VKRRILGLALDAWLPVTILVAWWFTSASSTSVYFPSLQTIVSTFVDTWFSERFMADVVPSMLRFLVALVIAFLVGISVGTVLGLNTPLRQAVQPLLDFFRALPKPALLPIAIVALGVGDSMKIFIIAFGAVWPILLNTIDGVRGVDSLLHDMSKIFGFTRAQRIFKLVLPSASPQIFVGARVSLAIGLILMVVSEMVASTNGLGYFVLLSQQTFAIPQMWAGIILLGVIGYLVNAVFVLCERRILAWHAGWRATAQGDQAPAPRPSRRRAKAAAANPDAPLSS
jgi:sulfonate transport system permease protein